VRSGQVKRLFDEEPYHGIAVRLALRWNLTPTQVGTLSLRDVEWMWAALQYEQEKQTEHQEAQDNG